MNLIDEDKEIKEYRQRHKNCHHCKYGKYHSYFHWTDICFWECALKDKFIDHPRLKAFFCKYYKVKED